MTPEQFCYWLQGRAELSNAPITQEEWESIKEHLKLVFTKVTNPAPGEQRPTLPLQPGPMFPNYPFTPVTPASPTWPRPGDIICSTDTDFRDINYCIRND